MKVFVSADIEGVTGIAHWDETDVKHTASHYFVEQMTKEVNAVCMGLGAAGVQEVVVKDAHDTGRNIPHDRLPRYVKLHRGWSRGPLSMLDAIDASFDAAIFVGYHSGASSDGNPLAHTFSGGKFQSVYINGEAASEMTMNAYLAGHFGVPVVMVTGDKALCKEAKALIERVHTVDVMEGIGDSVLANHPDESIERIFNTAKMAVSGNLEAYHLVLPKKFEVGIEYKHHHDAYQASFFPGVERIHPKAVRFVCDNFYEVMRYFIFL